jgi:hypothetical protein
MYPTNVNRVSQVSFNILDKYIQVLTSWLVGRKKVPNYEYLVVPNKDTNQVARFYLIDSKKEVNTDVPTDSRFVEFRVKENKVGIYFVTDLESYTRTTLDKIAHWEYSKKDIDLMCDHIRAYLMVGIKPFPEINNMWIKGE